MKLFIALLLLVQGAYNEPPAELNEKTCQEMVVREGVGLANIHWGYGVTMEQWDAKPFRPGLPQWYMDLMDKWYADAVVWPGDQNSWLNHLLTTCKGLSRT